jgi:Spx/MgsR family transcriptional regulator
MIKVYGIKNCDSVKKALSFFKKHNLEYELHDFKNEDISCEKIKSWLDKSDIKQLFNSKSTTYRTLNLKELNLDDDGKVQWLCKENMLIKRPVVEFKSNLLIGFNEDNYKGVFL